MTVVVEGTKVINECDYDSKSWKSVYGEFPFVINVASVIGSRLFEMIAIRRDIVLQWSERQR